MAGERGGSWWNPIDNLQWWANNNTVANAANSMTSPSLAPSGSAGIGISNPTGASSGFTDVLGLVDGQTSSATDSRTLSSNNNNTTSPNTNNNKPAGPSYDPYDLDYLDTQKSLYESLYGKLDDTRSDGIQNLKDQYQLGLNKANTSRSRVLEGYQTKEEDTKRSKVNAFNNVDQNTNSLANSVRRLLGLAGAAGSSAALYDLPAGIAREASRNRGNVMSDFATNMRGLDQARKYSEDDYNALLGDLERQKATGTENFEAGILGQRQNIQNTLADIAARRAKLLGQDPNSALRGYQEKYLNFQDQIQGLPEKYRKAVQARDVAVKPVSLKDYMVDRAAINANRQMGQDPASPYAQFLKKQQEEEEL